MINKTKIFNSLNEIQKYYDEKSNTYLFKEKDDYIDLVVFNFNLDVKANIDAINIKARVINANDINATNIIADNIIAKDINACDIKTYDINAHYIDAFDIEAYDIKALDIDACDIKAENIVANNIIASDIIACNIYAKDIIYWAVCCAYFNITCNSIKGRRKNAKHFVLDGKLEALENE